VPLLHKFLLGNPLLARFFPAIEETNQVLQFSLRQIEARQRDPVPRRDLLNQLLETHKKEPESLTVEEIIAITTTNVIAGSDTTAISLSSVFYFLSKHPKVRARLEKEISDATQDGRASSPITYAEAVQLPYLYLYLSPAHPLDDMILTVA
jgi:cytochrome P450